MWNFRLICHAIRSKPIVVSLLVHAIICGTLLLRYSTLVTLHLTHTSHPIRTQVRIGRSFAPLSTSRTPTAQKLARKKAKKQKTIKPPKKIAKKLAPPAPKPPAPVEKKVTPPPVLPARASTQPAPSCKPTPPAPAPITEFAVAHSSSTTDTANSGVACVQARIQDQWRPPRGRGPRAPCTLKIFIGKGRVQGKGEVIASSGHVAFDMAARQALMAVLYPPEFWNRTLIIQFS